MDSQTKASKGDPCMMKVGAATDPTSLAGAIVEAIRRDGKVDLRAIGAGAVNQAVKSIAIARGPAAQQGTDLICIPAFEDLQMENGERTAVRFLVRPR